CIRARRPAQRRNRLNRRSARARRVALPSWLAGHCCRGRSDCWPECEAGEWCCMRVPMRAVAGNLRWTRSGAVWADWILSGLPYGLRPVKDKHAARDLHTALFRALPGQSLLASVCSGTDPAAIVERMLAGVDEAACPAWVAECEA